MSRFYANDDGENWDYIRWAGAAKQAFTSKYGLERLRELEAALVALPRKRLAQNELVETELEGWAPPPENYSADVCAVGAYCAYKMGAGDVERGKVALLERVGTRGADGKFWDWGHSESDTIEAGVEAGLRRTMAWEIGFFNDDTCYSCSPEKRYEYTLAWVRRKIAQATP